MRAVVQRVASAEVHINGKPVAKSGPGLLVFLGIEKRDTDQDAEWLAEKLPRIRCFEGGEGRMNRSIIDTDGEIMVISQFTLFGSLRKGNRPSFNRAADPDLAVPLYEKFVNQLQATTGKAVATGIFGAMMKITALNDGPVTLILDTKNKEM